MKIATYFAVKPSRYCWGLVQCDTRYRTIKIYGVYKTKSSISYLFNTVKIMNQKLN